MHSTRGREDGEVGNASVPGSGNVMETGTEAFPLIHDLLRELRWSITCEFLPMSTWEALVRNSMTSVSGTCLHCGHRRHQLAQVKAVCPPWRTVNSCRFAGETGLGISIWFTRLQVRRALAARGIHGGMRRDSSRHHHPPHQPAKYVSMAIMGVHLS